MRLKALFGENSIKIATIILVATLFLSNILGVLRDHFLAQKIPTDLLDTYFTAFRLPDLVFNVIILGAVSAAFVPIFSGYLAVGDREKAYTFANKIISTCLVVVLFVVLIMFIFMPNLIQLIAPHFNDDKINLTISLSRLLLLSPIIFTFSYFFSGMLNSSKKFLVTSLSPLFYNLSIILSVYFLADRFGVFSAVYGVIFGAIIHATIQIFPLKNLGYKFKVLISFFDKEVVKMVRLMLPRSIGLGANQLMLVGFTSIASGLSGGAIAIYSLADNSQTMPTVVFGASVATALFPTLSQFATLGNKDEISRYLQKAIISILFYLIPASVAIILLRIQIVRLVLGSGNFGWEQTIITADTLGMFAVSLVFSGLIPLFAKTFYAYKNTKIPTVIAIISIIISLIFGWFLSQSMGVIGLALAFSIGSLINAGILFIYLLELVDNIDFRIISIQTAKIIISSVAMAIALQWAKTLVGLNFDLTHGIEVLYQLLSASIIGASMYFFCAWLLEFDKAKLKFISMLQFLLKLNFSNKKR